MVDEMHFTFMTRMPIRHSFGNMQTYNEETGDNLVFDGLPK